MPTEPKKSATIPKAWDLTTGICPYGHKLDLCYREGHVKGAVYIRHYCGVRKAQLRAEREGSRKTMGRPPLRQRKPLNLRSGRKAENQTYGKPVPIVLVCGHEVLYDRNHISFRYSTKGHIAWNDPPLYCRKCLEFRKIHQIDNVNKGEKALVVWPMYDYELPEMTPLNTGW